ncbi:DsrE family protein [Desulfoferrobacter suflitae]|uniref:DsrE family protein n=1 Tax=Desulfoferrobacter suflitae TaxID=2865782 RepID=UPI0021640A25|nr:DsrE family protein [Desulfoferrobacter suflitae]MCK8600255.1 DsrE family protein [Desulfoferrobacter suflitae]
MAKKEKIIYILTHGADDPERATLPFVLANAAQAMDVEAVMVLQAAAVFLATSGCLSHVFAAGLPPLKQLVDNFIEEGGKILVCTPCIKERHIEESELIPGMIPTAAGALVLEILSANSTLVY